MKKGNTNQLDFFSLDKKMRKTIVDKYKCSVKNKITSQLSITSDKANKK